MGRLFKNIRYKGANDLIMEYGTTKVIFRKTLNEFEKILK